MLNTLLISGLISDLECKHNPVKAECSNKAMFIDSHTQKSKNERIFSEMQDFIHYVKTFDGGEFIGAWSNCNIIYKIGAGKPVYGHCSSKFKTNINL